MEDIVILLNTIVDIGTVSISPPGPIIETSQESTFSLDCSINITFLPWDVPAPSLVWFFNSSNSSLPDDVMTSNTSGIDTYTHTLHFLPLRESHMGTYTCQIEGNNRQSTTTSITICT